MTAREDEADEHWSEYGDTHRVDAPPAVQDTQRERVALERREAAWPDRERDISWLAGLKAGGHCGESTSEVIARQRRESRIDRILAALDALPTQPTDEAVRRELARMREVAADWRRPELQQVEGPNDLKIYGGTIADDIDRWADTIRSQSAEIARLQALSLEGLVEPDPLDVDGKHPISRRLNGFGDWLTWCLEGKFALKDTAPKFIAAMRDDIAYAARLLQAAPSAPLVGGFGSGSSPDGDTQPAVEGPSGQRYARADLRQYPGGPVVFSRGEVASIAPLEWVNDNIVKVVSADGRTGMWASDCWLTEPPLPDAPSQPVIRAGDET